MPEMNGGETQAFQDYLKQLPDECRCDSNCSWRGGDNPEQEPADDPIIMRSPSNIGLQP